jgi:hypothetical protein
MTVMDELTKSLGDLALSWAAYEGQLDWTTASDYTWDFDTDEYYAVWTAMERLKELYQEAWQDGASEGDANESTFMSRVSEIIAAFESYNEVGVYGGERESRAQYFATLLDVPFRGYHSA